MNRNIHMRIRIGTPTQFRCAGYKLYGMLHHAQHGSDARDTGVVLINAGPTDRAGPHRYYVKLAERLTEIGYPVLRFDPRGVGESEGYCDHLVDGQPIVKLFGLISSGMWIADTHSAIQHMMDLTGVKRIILGGHCGGALTALLAGHDHPSICAYFLTGTPVTSSSTTGNVADLPEVILKRDAKIYFKKLLQPSAWLRFLSLRTDYQTLIGVLRSRLRRTSRHTQKLQTSHPARSLNPGFVRAFEGSLRRGLPMMFVYGENDYLWHEFRTHLLTSHERAIQDRVDLKTIRNSNHNMTESHWQAEAYNAIVTWLEALPEKIDARSTQLTSLHSSAKNNSTSRVETKSLHSG
jgi:pimeloyl-ACP methyl ester carboxylesterase